jgi:hypothetical protein
VNPQNLNFSHFGRIFQSDFDRKSNHRASQLSKTIHTERHQKLRELLIARRKAAGLTQTVVADRLGKPPSYVARAETGASTCWSSWTLPRRGPQCLLSKIAAVEADMR